MNWRCSGLLGQHFPPLVMLEYSVLLLCGEFRSGSAKLPTLLQQNVHRHFTQTRVPPRGWFTECSICGQGWGPTYALLFQDLCFSDRFWCTSVDCLCGQSMCCPRQQLTLHVPHESSAPHRSSSWWLKLLQGHFPYNAFIPVDFRQVSVALVISFKKRIW